MEIVTFSFVSASSFTVALRDATLIASCRLGYVLPFTSATPAGAASATPNVPSLLLLSVKPSARKSLETSEVSLPAFRLNSAFVASEPVLAVMSKLPPIPVPFASRVTSSELPSIAF